MPLPGISLGAVSGLGDGSHTRRYRAHLVTRSWAPGLLLIFYWAVWSSASFFLTLVVTPPVGWLAWRALSSGVEVSPQTVVVRGWLRTVHVPREHVEDLTGPPVPVLSWRSKDGSVNRTTLYVLRTDARYIGWLNRHDEAQVDALREALGQGPRRGKRRR